MWRWLFPVVYLTVTHSITALMIAAGLFGSPALAADIALAHGATVATFYALSANTRNLILGQSGAISFEDILRVRLALVAPLAAAALVLALTGPAIAWWLALFVVLRRCSEWFNDLQLCKAELEHRTGFALGFLATQIVLFLAAAGALATGWRFAPVVLALWALLPLGLAFSLRQELRSAGGSGIVTALRTLLPHAGSTAVSGLALYVFRLVVVLLLAKVLAGDLFTAIAIGSFIGTLFANVVGPSVELHEQRTGRGMSRTLQLVLWVTLTLGVGITAGALAMPAGAHVVGKAQFFWLACGLSLVGGVVMVHAQRVRLRILRADDGRDVFGPEVLIHIVLLISAPLLIRFAGAPGATALYLVNAALAYFFYKSSEMAQTGGWAGMRPYLERFRFIAGFLLVFPLFFQLQGHIFNSPDLVIDSGGLLATLPLPVSLLACFGGIALLADYRRATRSLAFVLLLFVATLLSIVATTPLGQPFDRGKLLMLMQVLVPAFGLVFGEMFESETARRTHVLERAFCWACATIMSLQLAASWLRGQATLTHWLGVFSVYQHLQYVPVILACAALVAAAGLRGNTTYRPWGLPLLVLSSIYCLAAYSVLAISISSMGLLVYSARYLPTLGARRGTTVGFLALMVVGAQYVLLLGTPEYRANAKLVSFATLAERLSIPCTREPVTHLSPLVESHPGVCVVRGAEPDRLHYLIGLHTRFARAGDTLVVEGDIREGGVIVALVQSNATIAMRDDISRRGPFKSELRPPDGHYTATIMSMAPPDREPEFSITRIEWLTGASDADRRTAARMQENLARTLPLNLVERVGDWMRFGLPILASAEAFFFGHPKPMDRSVRTSAHNYYIDVAYNFGVVALLPLIGLIFYTLRLMWLCRHDFWRSERLAWIAAVVLFLVLLDSNFKVTLRQPYSGIFAYFLWGVLLARLRVTDHFEQPRRDSAASPDPGRL